MISPYEPAVELAEKLCRITPGDFAKKAFFANSGSEAVENAVKIARYYTKKPAVIVFENAYHGRTMLTLAMTSKTMPYKFGFGPTATEVYRMPFGDTAGADKLKDFLVTHVNPESVAAVVAEPVQGEGGFIAPPPGYFQELIKICHDNGILFIADEIQSGMGRTGKMFAIEHWGVEPDLITVAKSLAAGMPLAAVVGKAEIMDVVHPWGLGGTYGGNPVACAAALAVLKVFEEENMLEKSVALGRKLKSRFEQWQNQFDILGEIRGLGAMLGIELVKGSNKTPAAEETGKLVKYCNENGLLALGCGTYGNIIRVLAPFVITDVQLEKGLSIMEEGLAAISK
jgi:4-aminobutyrate aminotransferase/(S)-3-amino-2-methylpropionate transaminase